MGKNKGPRTNNEIRIRECRLTGNDGHQYGIVTMEQARLIAEDRGLDLVEVAPNAKPPVVKIIDYGKFKYEEQKRLSEAKKKQIVTQLKEIQFRPNIDVGDLDTKVKRAERFLMQGDKVKMVMQFRGREMAYKEQGLNKFRGIINSIEEMGALVESPMKMMGNRAITILAADKILQKKQKDLLREKKKALEAAAENPKTESDADKSQEGNDLADSKAAPSPDKEEVVVN